MCPAGSHIMEMNFGCLQNVSLQICIYSSINDLGICNIFRGILLNSQNISTAQYGVCVYNLLSCGSPVIESVVYTGVI